MRRSGRLRPNVGAPSEGDHQMDLVFSSPLVMERAGATDFNSEAFMHLQRARTSARVGKETFRDTGSARCEVMGDFKLRGRSHRWASLG